MWNKREITLIDHTKPLEFIREVSRTLQREKATGYTFHFSNEWHASCMLFSQTPSLSFFLCWHFSLSASLSRAELGFLRSFLLTVLFYDSILLLFSRSLCLWLPHRHMGKTSFTEKAQIRAFKHPNVYAKYFWMSPLSQIFHILHVDEYTDSGTMNLFLHCATYLKK